jgi:hypothetical protein
MSLAKSKNEKVNIHHSVKIFLLDLRGCGVEVMCDIAVPAFGNKELSQLCGGGCNICHDDLCNGKEGGSGEKPKSTSRPGSGSEEEIPTTKPKPVSSEEKPTPGPKPGSGSGEEKPPPGPTPAETEEEKPGLVINTIL